MFLRSPLYLYLGVDFFFCLLATMSPERPKNVPNSKFFACSRTAAWKAIPPDIFLACFPNWFKSLLNYFLREVFPDPNVKLSSLTLYFSS